MRLFRIVGVTAKALNGVLITSSGAPVMANPPARREDLPLDSKEVTMSEITFLRGLSLLATLALAALALLVSALF